MTQSRMPLCSFLPCISVPCERSWKPRGQNSFSSISAWALAELKNLCQEQQDQEIVQLLLIPSTTAEHLFMRKAHEDSTCSSKYSSSFACSTFCYRSTDLSCACLRVRLLRGLQVLLQPFLTQKKNVNVSAVRHRSAPRWESPDSSHHYDVCKCSPQFQVFKAEVLGF